MRCRLRFDFTRFFIWYSMFSTLLVFSSRSAIIVMYTPLSELTDVIISSLKSILMFTLYQLTLAGSSDWFRRRLRDRSPSCRDPLSYLLYFPSWPRPWMQVAMRLTAVPLLGLYTQPQIEIAQNNGSYSTSTWLTDLPPIHKMENEITLHLSPVVMSIDEYNSFGHKMNSSDAELCTLVEFVCVCVCVCVCVSSV